MAKSGKWVNERILKGLKDNSDTQAMSEFLLDLVKEEITHNSGLKRDDYKKKLYEWVHKARGDLNEN